MDDERVIQALEDVDTALIKNGMEQNIILFADPKAGIGSSVRADEKNGVYLLAAGIMQLAERNNTNPLGILFRVSALVNGGFFKDATRQQKGARPKKAND